jgi:hypothetical protein
VRLHTRIDTARLLGYEPADVREAVAVAGAMLLTRDRRLVDEDDLWLVAIERMQRGHPVTAESLYVEKGGERLSG